VAYLQWEKKVSLRREGSCSVSHAQQRKYRIGEQLDRKRSANLIIIIEQSFGLIECQLQAETESSVL